MNLKVLIPVIAVLSIIGAGKANNGKDKKQ